VGLEVVEMQAVAEISTGRGAVVMVHRCCAGVEPQHKPPPPSPRGFTGPVNLRPHPPCTHCSNRNVQVGQGGRAQVGQEGGEGRILWCKERPGHGGWGARAEAVVNLCSWWGGTRARASQRRLFMLGF